MPPKPSQSSSLIRDFQEELGPLFFGPGDGPKQFVRDSQPKMGILTDTSETGAFKYLKKVLTPLCSPVAVRPEENNM